MSRLLLALAFCLVALPALAQNGVDVGVAVHGAVQNRSTVNVPVTITTGGTFQSILAAQSTATSSAGTTTQRQALTIENNNASDACWLYIGATASATEAKSIYLLPGGSYTRYWPFVPSDNIAATCANTSDTLYVDYQ